MPICRILFVFCFSLLISSCDQKIPLKSIAIVSVTTDTRTPFSAGSDENAPPGLISINNNGRINEPDPAYSLTENEQTFLFKQAHSLLKNIKNLFGDKIEIVTTLPEGILPKGQLEDDLFEFNHIIPPFQRIFIHNDKTLAMALCKTLNKEAIATLYFEFTKDPHEDLLQRFNPFQFLISRNDISIKGYVTVTIVDHNGKTLLRRTFSKVSNIVIKHESEGSFTLTEQNRKAYEDAVTKLEAHVLEEIGKIIQ